MKFISRKNRIVSLAILTLIMMFILRVETQAATKKKANVPQASNQSGAVIMYMNRPAGSWIGATRADIRKSFGKPIQYAEMGTDVGYNFDSYTGIEFIYNTFSKPNNQTYCTSVMLRPESAIVNGTNLKKNYKGLVKLLGNPALNKYHPRTYDEEWDEWEPASYEIKFNLSNQNGKNLVASTSLFDLETYIADHIIISRK